METVNLKNELASLQKTIADGAIQFDVKGIKTKVAARQLIGTYLLLDAAAENLSWLSYLLRVSNDVPLASLLLFKQFRENFWYTTSQRNLTLEIYKLAHLAYRLPREM